MDDKDKLIDELRQKVCSLESWVEYLQEVLAEAKIPYKNVNCVISVNSTEENQQVHIRTEEITQNHAKYFYSMFKGRRDVYSKRGGKPNSRSGKVGYYTQCSNFWKEHICHRRTGNQITCGKCMHKVNKPLKGEDITGEGFEKRQ